MRAQRFEELVGYGFVRDFCTEDIQAKSGSGSVARISNEELSGCWYHSVYKAEFCRFWTHKYLTTLRIDNIVVNPADVLIKSSEMLRKSDAVDRCKQAWSLQGNKLKGIYTPDSISLVMCSLIRLKNSITKDTTRQKNRIKSQLRYLVIEMTWKFLEPFSNWLKPFVVWLRGGEMLTPSGR